MASEDGFRDCAHRQVSPRHFENIMSIFTVLYNDSLSTEIQYVKRRDVAKQGLFIEQPESD